MRKCLFPTLQSPEVDPLGREKQDPTPPPHGRQGGEAYVCVPDAETPGPFL